MERWLENHMQIGERLTALFSDQTRALLIEEGRRKGLAAHKAVVFALTPVLSPLAKMFNETSALTQKEEYLQAVAKAVNRVTETAVLGLETSGFFLREHLPRALALLREKRKLSPPMLEAFGEALFARIKAGPDGIKAFKEIPESDFKKLCGVYSRFDVLNEAFFKKAPPLPMEKKEEVMEIPVPKHSRFDD